MRHSPFRGHSVFFLQLHNRSFVEGGGVLYLFRRLTLCLVIIDLMFSMQE